MKKIFFLPLFLVFHFSFAQNEVKVYPSSWWVGMKNPHLQVMVHGRNISKGKFYFLKKDNPGIVLDSIQKTKNPNYLFLNFTIGAKC